jgi:hypothetical protein
VNLQEARTFRVPQEVVDRTTEALQRAGDDGYELFVLWSGVLEQDAFSVRTPHVPKQSSYKTRDGLLVRVDGEALHCLNAWLYKHGEFLAVQVHAHPTGAFHSVTDDTFPIVTTVGGLSVVVPDFARRGVLTPGTAVYRLTVSGWDNVEISQIKQLLEVVP